MDVLKFLKCIRSKRFELADLKEQRDEIYYSLMPSGIRYDLDKVQTSPTDRMPAVAGDLAEVQTMTSCSPTASLTRCQRQSAESCSCSGIWQADGNH